jgi:NADPH-dependent 2,4-dienoyl-CoA reductase/sulfur reductase-like enzyme
VIEAVDILVVGGGPAGMAAATMAATEGLSVVLIDERPDAGGQIYRGLEGGPFRHSVLLGPDYSGGSAAISRFRRAGVTSLFGASLWRIDMKEQGGVACYTMDQRSRRLAFRKLILATGAVERPVPFEGWTLPGVMTVGAAQLLLKSSAIAPVGRVAFAGNGPLMLLFVTQLLALGVRVSALLDTAPPTRVAKAALGNVGALVSNAGKIRKGLRMLRDIRAAQIPIHRNVAGLVARGNGKLETIAFEADGVEDQADVDTLLVHEGIIPNTQLSLALGCKHSWNERLQCLQPDISEFGESSIADVFIVGDGATVNGAVAAPASAEIAVGLILEQMAHANTRSRATVQRARRIIGREHAFRPFLEALYPPRLSIATPSASTIVCRCEEVTAGTLRSAVEDGAIGPAQAKAFTRCGMGPCQGRMCGPPVSRLIADEAGRPVGDVGAYNVRFPLKPVTVAEMAGCGEANTIVEAHHAA